MRENVKNVGATSAPALAICVLFMAIFSPVVFGATTTSASDVTISTNKPSYTGNTTIIVYGVVSEAMGSDVTVTITNPAGSTVATAVGTTDEDVGGYTVQFMAGGTSWGTAGNYTATLVFQGKTIISAQTSFGYTPGPPLSSQSPSSSTTVATSSTAYATSSGPSLPTTAALAVTGVLVLVVVGVLALRRRLQGRPSQMKHEPV